ncbi:hypothetical protein, partial [Noviherbaspirillum sp. Root189]|uniref:hypothetical protein n=1 Tax=Noviherbaspirillum sp. Root189 TaxID=1736487 RepID=UPI001F2999BF
SFPALILFISMVNSIRIDECPHTAKANGMVALSQDCIAVICRGTATTINQGSDECKLRRLA